MARIATLIVLAALLAPVAVVHAAEPVIISFGGEGPGYGLARFKFEDASAAHMRWSVASGGGDAFLYVFYSENGWGGVMREYATDGAVTDAFVGALGGSFEKGLGQPTPASGSWEGGTLCDRCYSATETFVVVAAGDVASWSFEYGMDSGTLYGAEQHEGRTFAYDTTAFRSTASAKALGARAADGTVSLLADGAIVAAFDAGSTTLPTPPTASMSATTPTGTLACPCLLAPDAWGAGAYSFTLRTAHFPGERGEALVGALLAPDE